MQYIEDRDGKALVRLPNGSKTSVGHAALRPMIISFLPDHSESAVDGIRPGELYEDCSYHPVLCTHRDGDEVSGISLLDGSQPRVCSIDRCGVRRLTVADAVESKSSSLNAGETS